MVTEQLVRLLHTTQSKYNALEQKVPNVLYYITDTRKIYKGDMLFSSNVEIVTELPTIGVINCIYIVSTNNTMYYWKDDTFHLIPLGSIEVPGEENDLVICDGQQWIKNSGIQTVSVLKDYDTYFNEIFGNPRNTDYGLSIHSSRVLTTSEAYTSPITITQIKITNVTDNVVIYDMSLDENLEDLNTNVHGNLRKSTMFYVTTEVETGPNKITILPITDPTYQSHYYNQFRWIHINSTCFTTNVEYNIEVTCEPVNNIFYYFRLKTIQGTSSTSTYSTKPSSHLTHTFLKSVNNAQYINIKSSGYNNAKSTLSLVNKADNFNVSSYAAENYGSALLSISDSAVARFEGNARCNITQSAQLYMHDYAKLNMDHSAKLIIHNGTIDIGDAYLKMDDQSLVLSMGNGYPSIGQKGGLVLCKESSVADGPKVYFNNNCQFIVNGDSARGPYFSLDPGHLFIGGTSESAYMQPNTDPPPRGNGPAISVDGASAVLIGRGGGTSGYTVAPGYGGKTWIKITPNSSADVCQLHLTGNIFIQHSGNSHEEMHDDSIFIMKKAVPVTTYTINAGRALYGSKNLARAYIEVSTGTTITARAEIKTLSDGIVKNGPTTSSGNYQSSLYNAATGGTRLAGTNVANQVFSYSTTANTSFWGGTYGNVRSYYWLLSNVPFTVVRQGGSTTDTNITYELPEGATGVFWEDLTPEEQLYWIELASNGHLKVPGSPKFEMMGDSEIALRNGCTITGNENGIKVNNKEVATNYVVDSENTATVEYLYNQLQSALARIEALENA